MVADNFPFTLTGKMYVDNNVLQNVNIVHPVTFSILSQCVTTYHPNIVWNNPEGACQMNTQRASISILTMWFVLGKECSPDRLRSFKIGQIHGAPIFTCPVSVQMRHYKYTIRGGDSCSWIFGARWWHAWVCMDACVFVINLPSP